MQKGIDYTGIAVIYFCHDGKGNFVMSKRGQNCRDERGKWDIGGGGIEFDENVEETLRKEIKEEYCTDILDFEFLGYRDMHREHEGKRTHWIALDFKVFVDPTMVKNGEPHKFDDVKWFTFDTVPAKEELHPGVPVVFEKYKNKLK